MQLHFENIGFINMNDIPLSGVYYSYKPSERNRIYQRPFYIWP